MVDLHLPAGQEGTTEAVVPHKVETGQTLTKTAAELLQEHSGIHPDKRRNSAVRQLHCCQGERPAPSGEDSTARCWNGASTFGPHLCNQDEEEGRQYKQRQYTPWAYSI